jgi:hypothetical protein
MIKLQTLKRIAHDIISDVEWVHDSHSEAEHLGVQRGLNMLIRHLEETNQYNDLKEAEEEELRQELSLQGWQTKNLWHVSDVLQNYECTSEQAMTVLENVLASEYITDEIFRAIDDEAENMEYHRIDNNDFI